MTEPTATDFSWREIGSRIRDWRLARGWSQQQLAQIAGISQSGVVHLEKGDTNPQLSTLREVALAFGKNLRELMFGAGAEPKGGTSVLSERIRRVVDSNDPAALSALECGVISAELLLERRSGRAEGAPPAAKQVSSPASTRSPEPPRKKAGTRGAGNGRKPKS
jgi:transcriptional regulator with XRE-family HTH domain